MIVWMLSATLAAALASQVASTAETIDLSDAWGSFRLSLQGADVPEDFLIRIDLMESRGELPPGWIVHPELGLFHLYNAVVHVITDDTPPEVVEALLGRDVGEGWTPVQLFVHATPTNELLPEDSLLYHALGIFLERGRKKADDYAYAIGQPLADPDSIEGSMWEADTDALDRRFDIDGRRAEQALIYIDGDVLESVFRRGLRGFEGSAGDLWREISGQAEGETSWLVTTTNDYPSDNVRFDDILQMLEAQGIFLLGGEMAWAENDDELSLVTDLDSDSWLPTYLALKHGFTVAQIQDGLHIPYYRNYFVHPAPPERVFFEDWMEDEGKDAAASRWIQRLPRRAQ